jgi:xylan 1,4-beta-xylosidase
MRIQTLFKSYCVLLSAIVLSSCAPNISRIPVQTGPVNLRLKKLSLDGFPVEIKVDVSASANTSDLSRIWRFFGADEPNYAYMKDGKELMALLGEIAPGEVYFRAHNLLCSGDGSASLKWGSTGVYRQDKKGNPIYDWTIVDRIFDTYISNGVRPYAQIGFMPKALSTNPEPYEHHWHEGPPYKNFFTGWAYPPSDYDKWSQLVYQWVRHCVDRYGRQEVLKWYWQTWNEANIAYWRGTDEDFFKLHDYAIDAVRRALPGARVGGPASACEASTGPGDDFLANFLEHCLRGTNYATGRKKTPLDFVAFHAKGSPVQVDGHTTMTIARQLRAINDGFKLIASYPELKDTPVIIAESDPDGCAACVGEKYAYRNDTMYSSYTAASFARKLDLAEKYGVNLEGALTWSFEFEDQPFFAGHRSLSTNGIDKPVMNVFRMFSMMSGKRLAVTSSGEISLDTIVSQGVGQRPDVSALASRDGNKVSIMIWHYHDDDIKGDRAQVELTLNDFPEIASAVQLNHYRIDKDYSNAYSIWKRMSTPQPPSANQYRLLQQRGKLAKVAKRNLRIEKNKLTIELDLPRQAVSLITLQWD